VGENQGNADEAEAEDVGRVAGENRRRRKKALGAGKGGRKKQVVTLRRLLPKAGIELLSLLIKP
jgi:hypothetical protein